MKILITGATGLIGQELGWKLHQRKHQVFVLSRTAGAEKKMKFPCEVIVGDITRGLISDIRLHDIEAVIHLAGESVAGGRWTEAKKKRIFESRVAGTKNLISSLKQNTQLLISASAVGFYGDQPNKLLHEDLDPGCDFLAKVCIDWESAVQKFSKRKVIIRTGFVLSRAGGALERMLPAFRWGLGGALGSGHQWMSWIHLDDLVNIYLWALENKECHGPYNAVAPNPVTNRQFSEILANILKKGLGPSVPYLVLKVLFGEMASLLVGSQRASSQRLESQGFKFKYSFLPKALHDLLNIQPKDGTTNRPLV